LPEALPAVNATGCRAPGVYFAAQNATARLDRIPSMVKRKQLPAQDTRSRIEDAALSLFNAEGTHAVSTRHVAAKLGISPGNLYYHFGNKEEIVLSLYERIEAHLLGIVVPLQRPAQSFDDVLQYLDRIFAHLWEFRFFYRDLTTLLQEVPGLKERYRALAERVQANARMLFASMVEEGWMEASDEQIDTLATNAWIVLSQWFTHWQVMSRRKTIQSADIHEGIRHLVALFSPLLKPPQRRQVQKLLDRPA
jgi:AcrR family transcriptional regulator